MNDNDHESMNGSDSSSDCFSTNELDLELEAGPSSFYRSATTSGWDNDEMEMRYRRFLETSGLPEDFTTDPIDDEENEYSDSSESEADGLEPTNGSDSSNGLRSENEDPSPKAPITYEASKHRKLIGNSQRSSTSTVKCDICKLFVLAYHFQSHMKAHEKNYVCSYAACKKRFTTSGSLSTHLKTHNGERRNFLTILLNCIFSVIVSDMSRPFVCLVCSMRFMLETSLNGHSSLFHPSKPKQVPSASKLSLKRQPKKRLVAESLKKFKCKVCTMSYIQSGHLLLHYKNKHPRSKHRQEFMDEMKVTLASRLSCPICQKKFHRPGEQKHHLSAHSASELQALVDRFCFEVPISRLDVPFEINDDGEPILVSDATPLNSQSTQPSQPMETVNMDESACRDDSIEDPTIT